MSQLLAEHITWFHKFDSFHEFVPLTDFTVVFHSGMFTESKHWDDSVPPNESVHL